MVEFSKGGLMKCFKHVALALSASATLAGAGMAQAQEGPSKPWSNDALYQQHMQVAYQKYHATADTVKAKYQSGMATCNTRFSRNLGTVINQVQRNKQSGRNHSGIEKFGELTGLSQTGNALTECQTAVKTYAQTTMTNAKTALLTTEQRLDSQYARAYGAAAAPARGGAATPSQQESAKLAVCQKQELASLSGRSTITPACQAILSRHP